MADTQEYYDDIKQRFADERELRLAYRPEGLSQYIIDLAGAGLGDYEGDPWAENRVARDPIEDSVEVLFIGAGFSALLTSCRLRERGVKSIRMIDRASDVGGTWYWNRYPGIACDVVAYDYLPLLDETGYVPTRHYAEGPEIWAYCQMVARKYDLYDSALFQTTVTSTTWLPDEGKWEVRTDRGDCMRADFVVCANGTLTKPKLARISGMETFEGHSFHTSRWDFDYTGENLEHLRDKVVGIIGTGASAVQAVPHLGEASKELYVFQRTPSSIDPKPDWETDPEWAASLEPGWQNTRRERRLARPALTELEGMEDLRKLSPEKKLQAQQNLNIDHMMRIHARIEEIVKDPATAEALKPWYMYMCKRPCIHNDYLPTFNRPNVHLVDTQGKGITEISREGPVFEDRTYKLDLLVYATGFEVQKTGTWNQIRGIGGVELNEKYSTGMRTLLGIHSHGFPNLFIMGGYQSAFGFNLTDVLNTEGEHIAACIAQVRGNGFTAIDCTEEAEERWVQEVIAHRGTTNRSMECTPGYYNFEGQSNRRQDGNYNGGFPKYLEHLNSARQDWEQYYEFSR